MDRKPTLDGWDIDESFMLRDVFQPIKWEDGQAVEFPIDFLSPTEEAVVAYSNIGYCNPCKFGGVDFVTVACYDVGASADDPYDAEEIFRNKVKADGVKLLYEAAKSRKLEASGNNVLEVERYMLKHFMNTKSSSSLHRVKLYTFTFGPYIIGVDVGTPDDFVMPFTKETEIVRNNDSDYYIHVAYGLAILNTKRVLLGKINGN